MSEQAWTPGPWLVRPRDLDDWGTVRAGTDGPLVALARAGDWLSEGDLDEHRRRKTDPYRNNAQLIASAPDLFGAVTLACGVMTGDTMSKQGLIDALEAARAALAKARGEQP